MIFGDLDDWDTYDDDHYKNSNDDDEQDDNCDYDEQKQVTLIADLMERIDTTADPVHEALTLQIELGRYGDDNDDDQV